MACPSSVKTGDVTFATRFVAAYMFLKVKGCRPMTYQHLTLRMFESARRNEGMVDQKIFKTAKKYGFDSVYTLTNSNAALRYWENISRTSDPFSHPLASMCW